MTKKQKPKLIMCPVRGTSKKQENKKMVVKSFSMALTFLRAKSQMRFREGGSMCSNQGRWPVLARVDRVPPSHRGGRAGPLRRRQRGRDQRGNY